MNPVIYPPSTIGIIGGGQLGRMMAIKAKEMGYKVASLDPTPNSPLAQVADYEIQGEYNDRLAIEQLAKLSDVITFEFENVSVEALEWLEINSYLPQGSELLKISQHRLLEKEKLKEIRVPVGKFRGIQNQEDLKEALSEFPLPVVLKTCRGGYDGKGQVIIRTMGDMMDAYALLEKGPCILEDFILFEKEGSVLVHRNLDGETTIYPIGENHHENHILHTTIVPARITDNTKELMKEISLKIAQELKLVGTLAIEFFITKDGNVFVNEMAPRPHNSGHYTMNSCVTCQFEQHIRAICNLPLGSTELLHPIVMVNILGEHFEGILNEPSIWRNGKIHLYGKSEAKIGRKMGHVNFPSTDLNQTIEMIEQQPIWNQNMQEAKR